MSYCPNRVSSQVGVFDLEQWDDASSSDLEIARRAKACDFKNRRKDIKVRHGVRDDRSRCDHAGPAVGGVRGSRRHTCWGDTLFAFDEPGRVAFVPKSMLADHVAVVAGEDHGGSLGEPPFFELGEQSTHVAIDRSYAGIVLAIELLDVGGAALVRQGWWGRACRKRQNLARVPDRTGCAGAEMNRQQEWPLAVGVDETQRSSTSRSGSDPLSSCTRPSISSRGLTGWLLPSRKPKNRSKP